MSVIGGKLDMTQWDLSIELLRSTQPADGLELSIRFTMDDAVLCAGSKPTLCLLISMLVWIWLSTISAF